MNTTSPYAAGQLPDLRRPARRKRISALLIGAFCLLTLLTTVPTATAATADRTSGRECRSVQQPATLPDGSAAEISGEYCLPAYGPAPRVIQFLVHGATYNHNYWDWQQDPATYNYIDKALAAGYAVLAVDTLGAGASTRPASTEVNTTSIVATLHQVITAVRAGTLLGRAYQQVEYVGHSFGSFYGQEIAAEYPNDVNAFLLTGSGDKTSSTLGQYQSDNVAANYLPRFAKLDSGYLTNKPGTRADILYYLPDANPAVVAYDQATEDTVTLPQLISRPANSTSLMEKISVPAFVIDGNHDNHYCEPDVYDCSTTTSFYQGLSASFQPSECLAAALEPAGHDLQLSLSAPATDARMLAWSEATIPPQGQGAHCAVRGAIHG